MKKKYLVAIISLSISIILVIISYVLFGERSVFCRIALILFLINFSINVFYFRNNIINKFRRGKNARLKLIESFAILFFSIAILSLIKSFGLNIDWTEKQLFNLSKESKEIISRIKSPLKITIFSYKDNEDNSQGLIDYAIKLSHRYESLNSKYIKLNFIDPIKDKSKADQYGVRQNGTIVFEMDERREYIIPNILVENLNDNEISYKGETIFSAIIDKLNNNKEINIYYLTGHSEIDFDSSGIGGYDGIKKLLVDRKYNLKSINLDHHISIPDDADILIIADPKTQFSSKTYESIENYINQEGNTLYLVGKNTISDINILLMNSGFVYLPNVAIDPSRVAKNSGEFSIIPTLSPKSEITILLRNKRKSVIFPSASIVYSLPQELSDTNKIYDINPLAKMSQYGFGETSFETGQYNKDNNDISGIYCLAISSIIANKNNTVAQRRSVVFGSVDFIDNARLYIGGNADLFLNSIDFLLRKDLKTTISPKIENLSISIPQPEHIRMIAILVLIWIVLWLIIATIILLKRKQKVKNNVSRETLE